MSLPVALWGLGGSDVEWFPRWGQKPCVFHLVLLEHSLSDGSLMTLPLEAQPHREMTLALGIPVIPAVQSYNQSPDIMEPETGWLLCTLSASLAHKLREHSKEVVSCQLIWNSMTVQCSMSTSTDPCSKNRLYKTFPNNWRNVGMVWILHNSK